MEGFEITGGSSRCVFHEGADNVHLDSGRQLEEVLGSVDYDVWQCTGCSHHQVLPFMAMTIARERGIAFSEPDLARDVESVAAMWRNIRDYMKVDDHRIPNPPIVASYSLVGLAAVKYPADDTTAAMVR